MKHELIKSNGSYSCGPFNLRVISASKEFVGLLKAKILQGDTELETHLVLTMGEAIKKLRRCANRNTV